MSLRIRANPSGGGGGGGGVTSVNGDVGPAVVVDTDNITEGAANLYYTTVRSQADSLVSSVAGRTGAVTIANTDVSGLGTSSVIDVGTAANKVVQLTAAAKLPAVDGSLLTNLPSAPVVSVNTATGAVVLDTDDITEGSTNLYYTTARSQGDSLVSSVAGRTGAVTIANTDVSGLGTSSTLDVGTAANKVVQLTATAKLPAVDGSLLTNLPSAPVTSVNTATGAVVLDTDDVTEGSTNLYYTTARSQGDSLVSSVAGRTGVVTIANTDVSGLGTSSVIDVGTTANKVVQLDATAKLPAVDGSLLTNLPSAPVTSVNTAVGAVVLDTDDVTEGSTNLYYTDVRADGRITNATGTTAGKLIKLDAVTAKLPAVDGSLLTNLSSAPVTSVNAAVGVVVLDTDDITEGSTNLYYTTARSQGDSLVSSVAGRTGVVTIANTDVSGLGTSSTLDVGTAANKVVQLTAAAKLPAVDGSLLTNLSSAPVTSVNAAVGVVVLDTDDVTEGSSNLYYTDVRADGRITNATGTTAGKLIKLDTVTAKLPAVDGSLLTNLPSAPVTSVNAAVGVVVLDTDDVTEGSTNLYYTTARSQGDSLVSSVAGRTGAVTIANTDVSGLGTSSTIDVGTTANKVVQLTAAAKLPAVDGSLLTNLPSSGGGWTYAAITSASSPVTASTSYHYGSNTSSGAIVFNLPALSGLSGGEQIRVKLNTAGNDLTLTPNGSDTVEGAATFVLSVVKSSVTVIADSGTNWEIV